MTKSFDVSFSVYDGPWVNARLPLTGLGDHQQCVKPRENFRERDAEDGVLWLRFRCWVKIV